MSRPAPAYDADSALSSKSKTPVSSLRVSHPGDSYEVEADRVADRVSRGERIASWSLSALNFDGVQRQEAPSLGQPQHYSTSDMFAKLGEAILANKDVKAAIERLKETPDAREAIDFAKSPTGIVIEGSAAIGVVAGLAAAHQPLPLQIPKIPLDAVYPGLGVKVTYSGPVDRPTGASITLSLEPMGDPKKLKKAEKEREQAKSNREVLELERFREGLRRGSSGPATLAEQQAVESVAAKYGPRLPFTGGAARQEQPAPAIQLTPPTFGAARKPRHATLLDKTLELKPLASPTATLAAEEKKKEEIPVQRKAEPVADVEVDPADVESVVRSSGRPLDIETRRSMESRIGFDFGKVRVHTDARAAASARALGARAYTVGSDVVFAAGRYAPHSAEGSRLLAHELTHVVQQTAPAHKPHPVVRPAPRHVQRLWGIDLPDAKSWLLGKLKNLKGYPLFCVVIGEDLITGQKVERNATNLIEGVLGLFAGGKELFERLKKAANAIETAYNWVVDQINQLGLTTEYFYGLLGRAIAAVELTHPIESWDRIQKILKEPLDKLIDLASRLADAALKFILDAVIEAFPLGKKVLELIRKAGDAVTKIAADPLKFAKTLVDALKLGFTNFVDHAVEYLGDGLKRWIFEEINLPDLQMPEHFDFASILKLVLQVLGLTYPQRRPQLVEKLGAAAVSFFESAASLIQKIHDQGFAAIWEFIKKKADNLIDTIIGKVREWAIAQIVKIGIQKIVALTNPLGEVIEVIKDIYETIKFFIEKAEKFVDLINSIVDGVADMVAGNIGPAAERVTNTLRKAIPLVLRFLAGIFGLDGIGATIRDIIKAIRAPVDEAIGKALDVVVGIVKPIWEKGKDAFLGAVGRFKEWWKKPKKFNYGEEEHAVTIEGEGDNPQIFVESSKKSLGVFLGDIKATPEQTKEIFALAKQLTWKKGELQKPEDDQKGATAYDQFIELLNRLKPIESPATQIQYPQEPHSLGGGQEADAFLSSDAKQGTSPDRNNDPPVWNDLGYLREEKYYVRGHLLSQKLGGLGMWRNMMPITNTVNQRMESRVESLLKEATAKRGRFYHYNVKAKYKGGRLSALDESAPAPAQKERAQKAEQRLDWLSWTVKPAKFDKDAGRWTDVEGLPKDVDGQTMPKEAYDGGIDPKET